MPIFNDMPGTDGSPIKAKLVDNKTAFMNALRDGNAVAAAGDTGQIICYLDQDKNYRLRLSQWCVIKQEGVRSTLAAVRRWLDMWWSKTGLS